MPGPFCARPFSLFPLPFGAPGRLVAWHGQRRPMDFHPSSGSDLESSALSPAPTISIEALPPRFKPNCPSRRVRPVTSLTPPLSTAAHASCGDPPPGRRLPPLCPRRIAKGPTTRIGRGRADWAGPLRFRRRRGGVPGRRQPQDEASCHTGATESRRLAPLHFLPPSSLATFFFHKAPNRHELP